MDDQTSIDFLRQTIGKVRDEVAKLMKETNYGNYLLIKKMTMLWRYITISWSMRRK
jgi:hypothetical protein